MFKRLFSKEPNPEVRALLRVMIPPEVGDVSDEAIDKASGPRGTGMLELLGFKSSMMAMVSQSAISTQRYGRDVSLHFGLTGMGRPTVTTHVVVPAAPFEVSHKDANLEALGLPSGVASALQALGPLDKGVRVTGAAGGITIERTRSSRDAATHTGNIQWLRDLQLAERLAEVFSPYLA